MVVARITTDFDWFEIEDASCVDTSFSGIAKSSIEPTLWPIETLPRQFHTVPDPPEVIAEKHLLWVAKRLYTVPS